MRNHRPLITLCLAILLLCVAHGVWAQSGATVYYTPDQTQPNTTQRVTPAKPLPVYIPGGQSGIIGAIIPPPLTGQGYLTVSTASVATSTASLAPNSPAYPTTLPNGYLMVKLNITATGVLYVCWGGGACSTTVGEAISNGESQTRSPPIAAPTLYCSVATACPVTVEW